MRASLHENVFDTPPRQMLSRNPLLSARLIESSRGEAGSTIVDRSDRVLFTEQHPVCSQRVAVFHICDEKV